MDQLLVHQETAALISSRCSGNLEPASGLGGAGIPDHMDQEGSRVVVGNVEPEAEDGLHQCGFALRLAADDHDLRDPVVALAERHVSGEEGVGGWERVFQGVAASF